MMHAVTRTAVLALALTLASPALAKQPPAGSATFSDPALGTLAFSSYAFGVTNTADPAGGGGGAGKATFSPFSIVRPVDAASPRLFQAAATGVHIATVTIVVTNGDTPVTYRLDDVIVSSVQHAGGADGATESLSLAFARITIGTGG